MFTQKQAKRVTVWGPCAVKNSQQLVLSLLVTLLFSTLTSAQPSADAPVFTITPVASKVTFYVKASVKLEGTFEKWDATLVFTSRDASTGVLDIKIQADSVHTGSTSKDSKLKGEHCFDGRKTL
jgi:polyisoprenoid-binding protein YceI